MNPIVRNNFSWKIGLLIAAAALLTLSFVYNEFLTNRSSLSDEVDVAESYIHRNEQDFSRFLNDTSLLRSLIETRSSQVAFERVTGKNYGIFIYTVNPSGTLSMNFWNTQLVEPPSDTYSLGDFESFRKLSNGYYFIKKRSMTIGSYTAMIYATIQVRSAFFLETDYLPDQFVYSREAGRRVAISENPTEFPVKSLSGEPLYYLEKKTTDTLVYNSRLTIFLRMGGLLLLLLCVHLIAESLARKKIWKGVVFLALTLLIIRCLFYLFPALLNQRQFEIFDPSIYGSNLVQRSLGDLMMNSVFLCWIVLFAWFRVQRVENRLGDLRDWQQWSIGILAVCVLIFSTLSLATIIRSIVADSKISFDVTNVFSLDRYTVVGFICLATQTLTYYYFTQLLFRIIFPLLKDRRWLVYFVISFLGLIYLTTKNGDSRVLFYIPVLLWLLAYTWLVSREGLILNRFRINIAGILFWIFVFSVSIAAIMLTENRVKEWEKRQFYAEKLATQTDPGSERLMNIALKYLDNNFLINNFERFRDSAVNQQLRDSILTHNYSGYLNKYDTRLYIYDSTLSPLYNPDLTTFEALNTIVRQQARATSTPDLYSYETAFDKFTYITKRELTDRSGKRMGYFFIISDPKRYSSDALFPELFKQYRKNDPENSPIYSFAVYNQGRLIALSNKYPFSTRISTDKFRGAREFERVNNGMYDELWYHAGKDRVVVMARKRDTVIESITLFSYIFCSFIFLMFIVQVLSLSLRATHDLEGVKRFFHFNIRNQVHSTIIFISIFSFIIIGIASFNFFKARYNRNNSDRLSRTMTIMVNEMEKRIDRDEMFRHEYQATDSMPENPLQLLVDEVSDIHGVDVNVYDLHGDMQVSSEANVYTKGVLSKKMEPEAYFHLSRLNLVEHVQQESIANLSYLSIYAPVRDPEGTVYAYLSIPYFTSQPELNQEISNFIVTIINLNAFILLVAGLIALFITNRITRSFSIISSRMKEVNLGSMNEEIVWNRDDEIGDLVKEYNKMVAKLGQSAEALAKTEREGAWREMARQVAHEIKNPLTPMKLSMQHLQRAISGDHPNVKELSGNVARTLVEQIDHLSKIAADFSQFANISYINAEEFDLHDVIGSLQELFSANEHVSFEWRPVDSRIVIHADKTQMNRLFTNLIANAIEACKTDQCDISLTENLTEDGVRISITDNGEGIPADMAGKIFMPNFTTKSSGTGLGLAMCKSIVEQAKGKIWFETERGRGTTFHVELQLAY